MSNSTLDHQLPDDQDPLAVIQRHLARTHTDVWVSKWAARAASSAIILSTAAIPFCIVLSTKWLSFGLGKVLPAGLAAVAAAAAGFLLRERPYERWLVFRRYERLFENERFLYVNRVPPYHKSSDARRVFAGRIAELQLALHDEWAGILPKSSEVASAALRD
jgi:hypothetical protein